MLFSIFYNFLHFCLFCTLGGLKQSSNCNNIIVSGRQDTNSFSTVNCIYNLSIAHIYSDMTIVTYNISRHRITIIYRCSEDLISPEVLGRLIPKFLKTDCTKPEQSAPLVRLVPPPYIGISNKLTCIVYNSLSVPALASASFAFSSASFASRSSSASLDSA